MVDFPKSVDKVYAKLGKDANYSKPGASPVPLRVITEFNLQRYGAATKLNVKTVIVCVRYSELSNHAKEGDIFQVELQEGTGVYTDFLVSKLFQADEFEHRYLAS